MKKWIDETRRKMTWRITRDHARHAFHTGHGLMHLVYFGFVWAEGHGMYAAMGGALLIAGIAGLFVDGGHG
jgi:hypothetical protein